VKKKKKKAHEVQAGGYGSKSRHGASTGRWETISLEGKRESTFGLLESGVLSGKRTEEDYESLKKVQKKRLASWKKKLKDA